MYKITSIKDFISAYLSSKTSQICLNYILRLILYKKKLYRTYETMYTLLVSVIRSDKNTISFFKKKITIKIVLNKIWNSQKKKAAIEMIRKFCKYKSNSLKEKSELVEVPVYIKGQAGEIKKTVVSLTLFQERQGCLIHNQVIQG